MENISVASHDAERGTPSGSKSHRDWIEEEVASEPYWFQKIQLPEGIVTPGWSNPVTEKLPYFGLPADMNGKRVLDIGCSEGFFSFEAERRGAREVIAVDSSPDSVRRFNICRSALGSKATAFLTSVYDLNPRGFGTFDVVMFFGVLYHLRHPLLALERIARVCTGSLLMQTANYEDPAFGDQAFAKFHPFGIESGPKEAPLFDPTVFWLPNAACVRDMLRHAGFVSIKCLGGPGVVFHAEVIEKISGIPPDPSKAPWS
jgi:tRNA (mo5U34)-methyltransferase